MPDYQKLKALLGKTSNALVGEGEETPAPLEGYGAMAKGLPADPGVAAGVIPTGSPIDVIAGGAGAKLGGAMAQDAGAILGNEIGSIGNVGKGIKLVEEPVQPWGKVLNDIKQSNPYQPQGYGKVIAPEMDAAKKAALQKLAGK